MTKSLSYRQVIACSRWEDVVFYAAVAAFFGSLGWCRGLVDGYGVGKTDAEKQAQQAVCR